MTARLVFLSGSRAGEAIELGQAAVTIGRQPDRTITFPPDDIVVSTEHARIVYQKGKYVAKDDGSRNGTFVNSQMVTERALEHGDVIQLGPGGPSLRFVSEAGTGAVPTLDLAAQVERRAAEMARSGRAGESAMSTRDLLAVAMGRISVRTRRTFIGIAAVGLVIVGGMFVVQQRNRARFDTAVAELSASVAQSRSTLERDLAEMEARYGALRDLVATGQQRVARLNRAGVDAIARYGRGVALIGYSYGYTERGGSRLLRHVLDAQGQPVMRPERNGQPVPAVSFEGSGPPVQRHGVATGFLIDSSGFMLTAARVGRPWEGAPEIEQARANGLELSGQLIEARAYFPPGDRAVELFVDRVSDRADVAVLRIVGPRVNLPTLPLAPETASPQPGDQLLHIGYPADLENLLFRVDSAMRVEIRRTVAGSDQRLLEELARRRLIQPVITDGSVSQGTDSTLINSAAARLGGSGGPLIDARQRVVGLSHAGSAGPTPTDAGVPIRYAWDIIPSRIARALGKTP